MQSGYPPYSRHAIESHIEMFQLGDYFVIPDLKTRALAIIRQGLESRVGPAGGIFGQVDPVDNPGILIAIGELLAMDDMHPQHEVFNVIANVCSLHIRTLWRSEGFQDLFTGNKSLAKAIMDKHLGYVQAPQHSTKAFDDLRILELRGLLPTRGGEHRNNPVVLP